MSVRRDVIASKAFEDHFGQYMVWSGVYNKSLIYSVSLQVFFLVHTVFLVYTAFLTIDDDKLMGLTAHAAALRVSMMLVWTNCFLKRKDFESILIQLGLNQVHDYQNTLNDQCTKEIEAVRKKCDGRRDLYATIFRRVGKAVLTAFWFRSLMEYYRGEMDNPKSDNGINKNLPVKTYLPFDSHEWPVYHIALLCEVALVMMFYVFAIGHDCSFICFSEDILRELEIIIITLRDVEQRSDHLRKEMNLKISKKESIHICLKHSVIHHQKLIEIFGRLKSYCYHSLLFMLSGGAFLVCLSCLVFTSDKISLQNKVLFMMYVGDELFHILIFCYYGQLIMDRSTDVGNSLYNSPWTRIAQYVKPGFIMVKLRCHKPLTLTAGGFMTPDLDTYGNVLRTAYSYLNLLKAIN